jgi:hypothetical protein
MAVYKWQNLDKFSFTKRFELAYQAYRESLEEQMDEFIRDTKHNSQIAQIFRLKAAWPEKYREETKIYVQDSAKELLEKLTQMAGEEIKARERLEGVLPRASLKSWVIPRRAAVTEFTFELTEGQVKIWGVLRKLKAVPWTTW